MKKSKPLTSEAQALRYAYWLLGRRAHSRGEMEEKFRRRSLPPEIGGKVLARLEEKRYLDDREFARQLARAGAERGLGPGRIAASLRLKRIDRSLCREILSGLFTGTSEKERARELLARQKKRFLGKKNERPGKTRERAFGFLVRKGYSLEAARLAVAGVFGYNPELLEKESS